MASKHKVAPRISAPGSDKFPQRGPHNPNVGTSGSGMAPRPRGGAAMPGNDRPSHPGNAGLARVKDHPSSPTGKAPTAGSFTPVQNNAQANLTGQAIGQAEVNPRFASARVAPQTQLPSTNNPVATGKPKRRGTPAPFYGDWS